MMGAAVLFGADGIIPGAANFNPALTVALYEAARSGDRNRTAELQLELVRMRQFYTEGGSPFVAMKAACEMMNISGTATSFAYVAPSAEKRQRIRELLEREGLLS